MGVDWYELAERLGVATSYWSSAGDLNTASESAVQAVCDLLLDGGAESGRSVHFDDVVLVRGGTVRSGLGDASPFPVVTFELEDGTVLESPDVIRDLSRLPVGIHALRWEENGSDFESTVLAAPARFAEWPDPRLRQSLVVFSPTYALWERDDRRPSFDALARLGEVTADLGVDTVATLPLYAPGPPDRFETSPYSPISRFHWNELLIPPRLLDGSRRPGPFSERVDWAELHQTCSAELDHYADTMSADTRAGFDEFLATRPDVASYAAFVGGSDRRAQRRHQVGQWLAEQALDDVAGDLGRRGQKLALDLPVGARLESWETATWPELFNAEATIGAPPDTFFALGQDWELPALNPAASRRTGHRVWRDLLWRACRFAGVLRIDHIMQVHRIWWIPRGHDAADGVYVHYPADELLAVAAIVAEQTGTLMVGEDLGTVPVEVSQRLADWGMVGMYEEIFSMHTLLGESRETIPPVRPGSWAGIRTHDMPALAVTLSELDTGRYRGLLGAEIGRDVPDEPIEVAVAMSERLRTSDAHAAVFDLHDLVGERAAHNEPGVINELNWTHRLPVPVAELADEPSVAEVLGTS